MLRIKMNNVNSNNNNNNNYNMSVNNFNNLPMSQSYLTNNNFYKNNYETFYNNNISNSQFQPNQTVRNNNFNADEYLKKIKISNKKDEMEFSKEKEYLKQSKENFNKSSLK